MPGKQNPTSNNNLPKNWPPHLQYLRSPSYSPTLCTEEKASLRIKPQDANTFSALSQNLPKGPYPTVKITPITDSAHPAHGQAGLFATRDLKPGSFILEYLGVIHHSPVTSPSSPPASSLPSVSESLPPGNPTLTPPSPNHSLTTTKSTTATSTTASTMDLHAASDYDLSLDRTLRLAIDAAVSGNEARFINDYRGIAARPNAEFREVWSEARKERGMGVWVLPVGKSGGGGGGGDGGGKQQQQQQQGRRGVRRGEEILVSYGRGFWGARKRDNDDDDGGTG